ncbi:MAG: helix-turn-helix domain-containing protein, partial [Umezawaea sp.]
MTTDPSRVATRDDFCKELVRLREEADLTIRQLSAAIDVPVSTLGNYFTGVHLPKPDSTVFRDLLRACGVTDDQTVAKWVLALRRARRRVVPTARTATPAAPPEQPTPTAISISVMPPVDRLTCQPTVRGRVELLDLLSTVLCQPAGPDSGPRVHVLHGFGGCGKSTVALALARQAELQGIRVWWVSAGDPVLFAASVQSVAVDLGIAPAQLHLGSLPDRVWACLAAYGRPWMLVFDEVDEPLRLALPGGAVLDGNGWVRPVTSACGAVVVTTRTSAAEHWAGSDERWFRLHAVDTLSPDDGARVLLELAGDGAGDIHAAKRLSTRLGGLPLALRLAGRYLGEVNSMPPSFADQGDAASFDDYTAAMDKGKQRELLDGRSPSNEREVIWRTWELSLDLLSKAGAPEARHVLRLLSCLRQAPIPIDLLRADIFAASPLFPAITARRLWHLLNELVNVGLVDRQSTDDGTGGFVVLHTLVREVSRQQDDMGGDTAAYLNLLAALLAHAVRDLDPKHPS